MKFRKQFSNKNYPLSFFSCLISLLWIPLSGDTLIYVVYVQYDSLSINIFFLLKPFSYTLLFNTNNTHSFNYPVSNTHFPTILKKKTSRAKGQIVIFCNLAEYLF